MLTVIATQREAAQERRKCLSLLVALAVEPCQYDTAD
ncbi:Uncharacterised protein [Vibrio cholerae]|nr:Uncharacterised protein [Vibrio cholerae]